MREEKLTEILDRYSAGIIAHDRAKQEILALFPGSGFFQWLEENPEVKARADALGEWFKLTLPVLMRPKVLGFIMRERAKSVGS